jgi:hypothetical protein
LRQKGLIEIVEKGRIGAAGFSPRELTPIERRVFAGIAPSPKIARRPADGSSIAC